LISFQGGLSAALFILWDGHSCPSPLTLPFAPRVDESPGLIEAQNQQQMQDQRQRRRTGESAPHAGLLGGFRGIENHLFVV
jgi:hypothetical protein